VANLESIARRVFEEYGVIARVVWHWAFDMAGSRRSRDFREAVHLGVTFRPESDSHFVRDVAEGFGNAKEIRDVAIRRLKRQPPFDANIAGKAQLRQEHLVERGDGGELIYPEVDMIKTPAHQKKWKRFE
jgi:hypothetical protein